MVRRKNSSYKTVLDLHTLGSREIWENSIKIWIQLCSHKNNLQNQAAIFVLSLGGGESKTLIRNGLLHPDGLDTCWLAGVIQMLYVIIFTTLQRVVSIDTLPHSTGEYGQFLWWRPVNDDTEERFEYRMMWGHSNQTTTKNIEKIMKSDEGQHRSTKIHLSLIP